MYTVLTITFVCDKGPSIEALDNVKYIYTVGGGVNPYLQSVTELQRMLINVVKLKGIYMYIESVL